MTSPHYVIWKDHFSVGQSDLDLEHQTIFKLLNELYDALQSGRSTRPVKDIVHEACDYAVNHFAHEEAILLKNGYPRFLEHVKLHRDYAMKVERIRNADGPYEDMAYELFQFLKEWWLQHVTHVDKDYAACMKGHNDTR